MRQPDAVRFDAVHLSTDVTLHYAERGDRTGEAIIFLHAYVDSWFTFSQMLPLLSPEYHAFAPDQRGHGDSQKPQCCYAVDDYVADVGAFMEAVGIEEATLVCSSSAGLIAQRVALDEPHRVSRLVLIGSPTTLVNNEAVREAGKEMLDLEDPISPEFVREFLESTTHHPVPEEFLSTLVSESLKVPARVWREYFEGVVLTVDDTSRLGEVEARAGAGRATALHDPGCPRHRPHDEWPRGAPFGRDRLTEAKFDGLEERGAVGDRHLADLEQVLLADRDRQ